LPSNEFFCLSNAFCAIFPLPFAFFTRKPRIRPLSPHLDCGETPLFDTPLFFIPFSPKIRFSCHLSIVAPPASASEVPHCLPVACFFPPRVPLLVLTFYKKQLRASNGYPDRITLAGTSLANAQGLETCPALLFGGSRAPLSPPPHLLSSPSVVCGYLYVVHRQGTSPPPNRNRTSTLSPVKVPFPLTQSPVSPPFAPVATTVLRPFALELDAPTGSSLEMLSPPSLLCFFFCPQDSWPLAGCLFCFSEMSVTLGL